MVWLLDAAQVPEADIEALRGRLGAGEAARHARFLRPGRQRQFLLGRMLLRQTMGRMLDLPAAALTVTECAGQAPRVTLQGAPRPLPFFSLSHSGRWVACALSADSALGLDIEVVDPRRDLRALAELAFGGAEAARLAALPEAARAAQFYRSWSEKEARYKLGEHAGARCVSLCRPGLSIVLCSALPLAARVVAATLEVHR
ncbi:MAG TPA: 4-phosphopantetheinyl transferase [Janthinobacterium sp.]|nr:4-phosphopantetheinyl transferase [Janthinobacterium sp.]